MNLVISGILDVPHIVGQLEITKVLSLIEPWHFVNYNMRGEAAPAIYRISMKDTENPNHYLYPKMHHIQDIVRFAETWKENDKILIHCHAGISRSTAAAIICLAVHGKSIEEIEETINQIRPQAGPNRLMCSLADALFNFEDGRLYNLAHKLNIQNSHKEFNDKGQNVGNILSQRG